MKPLLIHHDRRWRRLLLLALIALPVGAWFAFPFPVEKLEQYPAATVLTDNRGEPLRVQLGPGDLDCRPDYRPAAGDWVVSALIAAEDQRFRTHPGVDLLAILRAVGQNLRAGRCVSGASTLSTQVIRLLEPRPRRLGAKIIEAFRALPHPLHAFWVILFFGSFYSNFFVAKTGLFN